MSSSARLSKHKRVTNPQQKRPSSPVSMFALYDSVPPKAPEPLPVIEKTPKARSQPVLSISTDKARWRSTGSIVSHNTDASSLLSSPTSTTSTKSRVRLFRQLWQKSSRRAKAPFDLAAQELFPTPPQTSITNPSSFTAREAMIRPRQSAFSGVPPQEVRRAEYPSQKAARAAQDDASRAEKDKGFSRDYLKQKALPEPPGMQESPVSQDRGKMGFFRRGSVSLRKFGVGGNSGSDVNPSPSTSVPGVGKTPSVSPKRGREPLNAENGSSSRRESLTRTPSPIVFSPPEPVMPSVHSNISNDPFAKDSTPLLSSSSSTPTLHPIHQHPEDCAVSESESVKISVTPAKLCKHNVTRPRTAHGRTQSISDTEKRQPGRTTAVRREGPGWSGEWNQQNMQNVIARLRDL